MNTVYRMRDVAGELLYVGVSLTWPQRVKAHGDEKPWWSEVATISLEHFGSPEAAYDAEVQAIKSEDPRYNRGAYRARHRRALQVQSPGNLSISEVAKHLGLTPHTVRRYAEAGYLATAEPHTPGAVWIFRQSDLDRFVERRMVVPAEEASA